MKPRTAKILIAAFVGSWLAGCSTPPSKPVKNIAIKRHIHREPSSIAIVPIPPDLPHGPRGIGDVLRDIGPYADQQLEPYFEKAGVSYPPKEVTLVGLKQEKKLELWARDEHEFRLIHTYDIRAASGTRGPKLRQGDKQVPEGIYRIVGLNPNSNFHLSMRLNYPNAVDREHAAREGRSNPGSDIYIHGKAASIGCLALGDAAIDELFVLTARVGKENVKVVIAPHDPRKEPLPYDDPHLPAWIDDVYASIEAEIQALSQPIKLSKNAQGTPPRFQR